MTLRQHGNQHGFSLLELLVAFTIMAMSLGLLYRVAGGGARHLTDIAQHQQAAWLAKSLLEGRSSVGPEGWNEEGESAGFKWKVRSNLYNSGVNSPQAIPLHAISLSINWTSGSRPGQVDVTTLLPERRPQPGEAIR